MILRIWTTGIDESRAEEYETFARELSTPMFQVQPGFEGLLLARSEGERKVLTLWRDEASAHALGASESYGATVAAIEAAGFLRPPQAVALFLVPDSTTWHGPDATSATAS